MVDDIAIIPTGGVVWAGTAQCASNLYAGCGRTVLQWDETNDVWNAVYVHATQTAMAMGSLPLQVVQPTYMVPARAGQSARPVTLV